MVLRACAAVLRGGRILMVRHEHDGRAYWTLPGGGVEAGESPERAAERELAEETGLAGQVERALFDEPFKDGICRCFLVRVKDSQAAALGLDPEEAQHPPEARMLREVAWYEMGLVASDKQVSRVLRSLAEG